jgi:hypothetical protein
MASPSQPADSGQSETLCGEAVQGRAERRKARALNGLAAVLCLAGLLGVMRLAHLFDGIIVAGRGAEAYSRSLFAALVVTALMVFLLCVCIARSAYGPLGYAGRVGIGFCVAALLLSRIPYAGPAIAQFVMCAPAAFFAVVVVKANLDSWFSQSPAKQVRFSGLLATAGFVLCITLFVTINKYLHLAQAASAS